MGCRSPTASNQAWARLPQLARPPMLVVGGTHMPEQRGVRGIQHSDRVEESSRSRDLPRSREVHYPLGGVDTIADKIRPGFQIDRLFDGSKMEARTQAVRRKARIGRGPSEILRNRQRHIERVLGI